MGLSPGIRTSSMRFKACILRTICLLAVLDSLDARGVSASRLASRNALTEATLSSEEKQKVLTSEETKRQMLNVLGMDELPQPRQGVIPHQYMIHIYEKMSKRKSGYKNVNTIRGFVDVANDDSSGRAKFHQIYAFNISALPSSEKIISADLRLLRLPTGAEWKYAWAHGMKYRAKLYKRETVNHVWNGQIFTRTELVYLDSVLFDIRSRGGDWKVFKAFKALREWQNGTVFVHKLELHVESVRTGYFMPAYEFGLAEHGRPHYKRALLVSFTNDGRVPRTDEDTENDHRERRSNGRRSTTKKGYQKSVEGSKSRIKRDTRRRNKWLCARKTLYVDFTLLGWAQWIIAPRGYNAYYCQGVCKFPIAAHLKPTNHAIVQTTLHQTDKRRVPPACCVPHKLSGLSMLFIDKGDSVVYRKYDNMIVESCGCK